MKLTANFVAYQYAGAPHWLIPDENRVPLPGGFSPLRSNKTTRGSENISASPQWKGKSYHDGGSCPELPGLYQNHE